MQKEVAERLAERLPLFKMTPEHIIDLGAGTGFLSQHIRTYYPESLLTQVDLSLQMLQHSRQETEKKTPAWRSWLGFATNRKNFFVNADAYQLPFADHSVDMIVSSLMLQWCDDLDKVLAECHRVLKPEGLFYIATLGPDTLMEIRQAWRQVDDETAHISPFIDMHDFGDALSRAGFLNGVLDTENIQLTYTDARKAIQDLKDIGATNASHQHHRGLTGKQRWARFLSAYNAQVNAEGRISATFELIYAHAWATTSSHSANNTGKTEIPISAIKRWQNPVT
jgi:malonyl-CoA O-methyltransferase